MPITLTALSLLSPDGTAVVVADFGQALDGSAFTIEQTVEREGPLSDTLTLGLRSGAPEAAEGTAGRLVEARWSTGEIEQWRIATRQRTYGSGSKLQITAQARWRDLAAAVVLRGALVATHPPDATFAIYNRSVVDAMAEIMASAPPGIAPGLHADLGVETGEKLVSLQLDATTVLEALAALCRAAGCSWEATVVPAAGPGLSATVEVNLVEYSRPSTAEVSTRLVQEHPGGTTNRQSLVRTEDASDAPRVVVPVLPSPEDGVSVTVAGARWRVTLAGIGYVRVGAGVVPYDGWGVAPGREQVYVQRTSGAPGAPVLPLTGTLESGRLDLGSGHGLVVGDLVRFCSAPDGRPLVRLETPSGVWGEKVASFDGTPYPNLLRDQGASDDLSVWTGGLPLGWELTGGATVTQDTNPLYAKTSGSSARVEAPTVGDGIVTGLLDITSPTGAPHRYLFAWMQAVATSGRVRLDVLGADGLSYPRGEAAEMGGGASRGLAAGALVDVPGPVRLRVLASAPSTVFYLDAATLVPSGSAPAELATMMGPTDLWRKAVASLREEHGVREEITSTMVDLALVEGGEGMQELRAGTWVRLREGYQEGIGWEIDRVVRLVQLTRTVSSGIEGVTRRGQFEQRRASIVDVIGFREDAAVRLRGDIEGQGVLPLLLSSALSASVTGLWLDVTMSERVKGLAWALTADGSEPVIAGAPGGADYQVSDETATARTRRINVSATATDGVTYRLRVRPLASVATLLNPAPAAGPDVLLAVTVAPGSVGGPALTLSDKSIANHTGPLGGSAADDVRVTATLVSPAGVAGLYVRVSGMRSARYSGTIDEEPLPFYTQAYGAFVAYARPVSRAYTLRDSEDILYVPNLRDNAPLDGGAGSLAGYRDGLSPGGAHTALVVRIHQGSGSSDPVVAEQVLPLP